jgi:hypothetical protein
MKAIAISVALEVASRIAFAQTAADSNAHTIACSMSEPGEHQCLETPSRDVAAAEGEDNWVISETTSPVNYTPIVTATALSRGGSLTQIAIYCRGGRTELVVSGPAVANRGDEYSISYRVNDAEPMQLPASPSSFGAGVAFAGDTVHLLQSLPQDGHIDIRISPRRGNPQDGRFPLGGLQTVRAKLAAACRWPNALAKPRK